MSGRLATTSATTRRTAARIAFVVLTGCVCGLVTVAGSSAVAQDDVTKIDKNAPLPADTPRRKPHEKYAVPNPDRRMFSAIEDFQPVASQDKNAQEYDAWIEVVLHAAQFETAELEQYAARDLVPLDLIRAVRIHFRLELIRFDGK